MAKRKPKEKDAIDLLLDQIDFHGLTQEDVLGQNGLVKTLTAKLLNRAMEAEMEHHLGYPKNSNTGDNTGNNRNGHTEKTVLTENQTVDIDVPRDRNGTFEPVIVPKYEKRIPLFNNQIISLYASGMTTRDIKAHLEKIYGIEVSPELVSRVTDGVMEEVREWQTRQLDRTYPIVYLDALRVNGRSDGKTCNKALYTALGVNSQGKKEVLRNFVPRVSGSRIPKAQSSG